MHPAKVTPQPLDIEQGTGWTTLPASNKAAGWRFEEDNQCSGSPGPGMPLHSTKFAANSPMRGEVFAVFPTAEVSSVDWNDTVGIRLWGERFPGNEDSIRVYIAFLVLACAGGFLVLLSSSHLIPWYYAPIAFVLVMPHTVFDVFLWQRTLAQMLFRHVSLLPARLNNLMFLVLMLVLAAYDESGGAVSTACLAVILVISNMCVLFYDAIHPSISRIAVVVALAILLSVYMTMLLAIYANFMLQGDVALGFTGSFSINAKSLVFGCLQNMVVMVGLQFFNRFWYPTDLIMLYSCIEVRAMSREAYDALRKLSKETRKMTLSTNGGVEEGAAGV